MPPRVAIDARGDAVERVSEELALVYVAATRTKQKLPVLSYGKSSRLP